MAKENYINTLELDNAELKKENAMLTQALKDTERTAFEIKYELEKENQELKKQLEGIREERDYLFNKLSTQNKHLVEENKKLEGVIQTYKILLKANSEENKELKDNWNKLKKIAQSQSDFKLKYKNKKLYFEIDELLEEMQKLESSDSND